MAPPPKATPEQWDFLEQNIDAYREAQKCGALQKFWPRVNKAWFDHWPETEDVTIENEEMRKMVYGKAISTKQKYVRVWFHNHGGPDTRAPKEVAVKPPKTTCCLQLNKYYSKKYYDERIASNVTTALAAFGDKKISAKTRLNIIHSQTTKAFNSETPEFKEKFVEEHKAYQERFAEEREKENGSELDPSPASYQAGIASIRAYFEQFAAQTAASGWSFVLLAGGPDPKNGGTIRTSAFHHGLNFLGRSISEQDPNFRARHLPAFAHFLTGCYTSEECDARALPTDASVNVSLSPPPLYVMSPSPTPEPTLPTPTPAACTKIQSRPIPASPIVPVQIPTPAASLIAPASPTIPASPIVPVQTPILPITAASPIAPVSPTPLVQTATLPVAAEYGAPTLAPKFSWDDFHFEFGFGGGFSGETAGNFDTPSVSAQYGPYPSLSAELQAALAQTFDTTNFGDRSGTGIIEMTPTTPLDPPLPGLASLDAPLLVLPPQPLPFHEAELPAMGMAIPQLITAPGAVIMPPPVPAMEAVLPAPPVAAMDVVLPAPPLVPSPTEVATVAATAHSTALTPLSVQTTGRKRRHDEVDTRFIVTTKRAKIPKKRVEVEALTADKAKGKENRRPRK
ncbi:hypothetical protein EYR38_010595 [Pleurotus pulmonarius]|nr:hypothetical protein EYR38_010595 [Pleurotus pulmonarius]